LGLSVIVGRWLGSYLDRFFGTGPWMLIVFTASGIAAGYRSVYRLLRRLQQEDAATPLSNDLDPKT
jgi:ATP synthase protein I